MAIEVQVFGTRKSPETRKALRFFAERRVKTHFVDLDERPAALGEIRRFSQKFGVAALIARDSRRFAELGLAQASYSDERWLDKLSQEPGLLRVPMCRCAHRFTVGLAEGEWSAWVKAT
ncbi:MAG: ArsC/Spx/MgsR family protein [Gemmatimonadaceae bacterium]